MKNWKDEYLSAYLQERLSVWLNYSQSRGPTYHTRKRFRRTALTQRHIPWSASRLRLETRNRQRWLSPKVFRPPIQVPLQGLNARF